MTAKANRPRSNSALHLTVDPRVFERVDEAATNQMVTRSRVIDDVVSFIDRHTLPGEDILIAVRRIERDIIHNIHLELMRAEEVRKQRQAAQPNPARP